MVENLRALEYKAFVGCQMWVSQGLINPFSHSHSLTQIGGEKLPFNVVLGYCSKVWGGGTNNKLPSMYCSGISAVEDGSLNSMKAVCCIGGREWILGEGWEINITKQIISDIFFSHAAVVILATHSRQVV